MIRSTVKLLTGSGLAVIIGMVTLPILTRVYTPEMFGNLHLFQTLTLYAIVYSSLRYEVALLISEEGEKSSILTLCLGALIFTSVATAAAAGLFELFFKPSDKYDAIIPWLPLGVFAAGLYQILNNLTQRDRDYQQLSQTKVFQAGAVAASGVALGAIGLGTLGLLASDMIGKVVSAGTLAKRAALQYGIKLELRASTLWEVGRKYKSLPLMSVPGGIINVAGGSITSLMMFLVFDPNASGQYALADKIVLLPLGIIAATVSQVFTAELAANLRSGVSATRNLFWKIVLKMGAFSIMPAAIIALYSEFIFIRVFGTEWGGAAQIAKSLSILMIVNFAVTPVNMTIMLLDKQLKQLLWEILRLIVMTCAWLYISKYQIDQFTAVNIHVACSSAVGLVFLYMADRELRAYGTNSADRKNDHDR